MRASARIAVTHHRSGPRHSVSSNRLTFVTVPVTPPCNLQSRILTEQPVHQSLDISQADNNHYRVIAGSGITINTFSIRNSELICKQPDIQINTLVAVRRRPFGAALGGKSVLLVKSVPDTYG